MKKNISIQRRIINLVMGVSAVLIAITILLFAFFSVSILKSVQKESLLAGLGFAAEYCAPSLLFDDPNSAIQVLNNYKAMPIVKQAVLLDQYGKEFASYPSLFKHEKIAAEPLVPYAKYQNDILHLAVAVTSENEQIGQLHVIVSTQELTALFWKIVATIIVLIPILLVLAYLFGARFQKRISGPILDLARIAEQVRYGSEMPEIIDKEENTIEIASLTDRFREMVLRIKSSENELTSASIFLQTIVDSMPSLLIVVDQKQTITLCNISAVYLSEKEQPIGSDLFESFPFIAQFATEILEVLQNGDKKICRAVSVDAQDMHQCDIEFYPLNNLSAPGVVLVVTDVSELVEKDMQLIQIQKMETVGTLAGGLAHDFNNILAGIVGTLSLMEYEDGEPIDPVELKEYIAVMNHAGNRAKEMIDHLLTLSHKSDTTYSSVDLKEIISHVVKFCEHSIDKRVIITTTISTSHTTVKGNGSQLEQVILNLCINASHAMTIMRSKSEQQGGELKIDLYREGSELVLMIRDSGVGIPEQNIRKIFDPFYTTKQKGTGTGLGLSMVYNIINQHGGAVTVESVPGQGTQFKLSFKALSGEVEAEILDHHVDHAIIGEGKTILVIDDDAQIRMIAGKMLQRFGFTLLFAEDGLAGVERFKTHHQTINVVLLDMVMPGLSGKEVFEKLKEIDASVPVILSSGFGQDDRVVDTLSLGVAMFVHKPYTIKELQEALTRVLSINKTSDS